MLDPTSLFSWDDFVDQRTLHVRTLVVTLGHFADGDFMQIDLHDADPFRRITIRS